MCHPPVVILLSYSVKVIRWALAVDTFSVLFSLTLSQGDLLQLAMYSVSCSCKIYVR